MGYRVAYVTARAPRDTSLIEQGLAGIDCELDVQPCSNEGEVIEAVKGAEVVLNAGMPMPRSVIETMEGTQAIVSGGHGFNQVDHDAATDHKIMVVNSAGFCAEEVSNHNIMMVLALAKRLVILDKLVRNGGWVPDIQAQLLPMPAIDGQTIGIIGFGNIGRPTARKAMAFGLEVISYDPYCPEWIAKEYRVELVSSLEELAQRSDYVVMQVPLNPQTKGLAGESLFKAMKPTAYFINTCRGPTVDEQALTRALQDGEIAGAGLDVFEEEPTPSINPLLKLDNVILTPHSAGTSSASLPASMTRMGEEAARVLKGTWPMSLVNPEVRATLDTRSAAVNV